MCPVTGHPDFGSVLVRFQPVRPASSLSPSSTSSPSATRGSTTRRPSTASAMISPSQAAGLAAGRRTGRGGRYPLADHRLARRRASAGPWLSRASCWRPRTPQARRGRAVLEPLGYRVPSLDDAHDHEEPVEDDTFEGNARLKAVGHAHRPVCSARRTIPAWWSMPRRASASTCTVFKAAGDWPTATRPTTGSCWKPWPGCSTIVAPPASSAEVPG